MTNAAHEQQPAFVQLRSEYLSLLTFLQTAQPKSDKPATVASQINQANVEFEIIGARIKDGAINQMWVNPNQPRPQPLGDLPWLFRNAPSRWGFGVKRIASGWAVASPHWCLILVSGAIAGVLGIRRSWRFSLRTLLIATSLVAVLLMVIVYAVK